MVYNVKDFVSPEIVEQFPQGFSAPHVFFTFILKELFKREFLKEDFIYKRILKEAF